MKTRVLQIDSMENVLKLYWKNVLIQDADDIIENGLHFPGISNLSYLQLCTYFYYLEPGLYEDDHILEVMDDDKLLCKYNPQINEVTPI